jgi:hypothetical protein
MIETKGFLFTSLRFEGFLFSYARFPVFLTERGSLYATESGEWQLFWGQT